MSKFVYPLLAAWMGLFIWVSEDFTGKDGTCLNLISVSDPEKQIGLWNFTVAALVDAGYVVGKNVRGAPYDW